MVRLDVVELCQRLAKTPTTRVAELPGPALDEALRIGAIEGLGEDIRLTDKGRAIARQFEGRAVTKEDLPEPGTRGAARAAPRTQSPQSLPTSHANISRRRTSTRRSNDSQSSAHVLLGRQLQPALDAVSEPTAGSCRDGKASRADVSRAYVNVLIPVRLHRMVMIISSLRGDSLVQAAIEGFRAYVRMHADVVRLAVRDLDALEDLER